MTINKYVLLYLVAILLSATSQVLLKKSATRQYKNIFREYINIKVMGSYSVFIIASLMTTIALRYVPLSLAPIIESTSYIFVSLLGWKVLKETFTRKKIIGIMIIMVGVIIFSL